MRFKLRRFFLVWARPIAGIRSVRKRIEFHNFKGSTGYKSTGEREAPDLETLLKNGFPMR